MIYTAQKIDILKEYEKEKASAWGRSDNYCRVGQ